MSPPARRRLLALGSGATCHGAFLAAVSPMGRGPVVRCRQPMCLGLAPVLWTAPARTPDPLAIPVAWGLHCAGGPHHEERRSATLNWRDFEDYRRRVPYLVPRVFP